MAITDPRTIEQVVPVKDMGLNRFSRDTTSTSAARLRTATS